MKRLPTLYCWEHEGKKYWGHNTFGLPKATPEQQEEFLQKVAAKKIWDISSDGFSQVYEERE